MIWAVDLLQVNPLFCRHLWWGRRRRASQAAAQIENLQEIHSPGNDRTCYYLDWDSKFSSYSLYLYRLCRKILLKPFCSDSIGNILIKDPLILRYSTDFNFYKDRKGEWPCASHTVDATSHFERMRDPEFSNTFGKPNWACLYIAVYTSSLSSTETLGRNW